MGELKKNILVLAYIRYSSHAQDEGNSVAAQSSCIEKYAEANGMEVENYYIDMARSGRNTNREQYQKLKKDIEEGNVQAKVIIVRALDRLHRNASNQLYDFEWFEKYGIRLIAVNDGTDTASKNYSKLITTVKAAVAEEYSDTLSKNTRAALFECAKQCRHLGGTPPIGFKVSSEGLYEIDELKAPIVRDIYRLYLQDMGYDYIIKYLNDKGYKTSEGNDFSKTSVNSILKNPKYMGTYVYDRTMPKDSEGKRNSHAEKSEYIKIANGMPAIISADDFNRVQAKMAENASKQTHRTGKNYYALNGHIKCPECGKAFSGNVNNSNGRKYFQYRASCKCGIKSVRMDHLNNFVFYALQQCIFSPENKDKIIKKMNEKLALHKHIQSDEINALMNKINGLENAQNNLTGYLETGRASKTILEKMQKNETELEILNKQLEAKSKEIYTVDSDTYDRLICKFRNYMCNVKSPEAVALRNAAIKNILPDKDKITVTFNSGVPVDDETAEYFNEK